MKKYEVSEELMNELLEWQKVIRPDLQYYDYWPARFSGYKLIYKWFSEANNIDEQHNRLISLINFAYGVDIFEVEKPKKWIVRSKHLSNGYRYYVSLKNSDLGDAIEIGNAHFANLTNSVDFAFRFSTKEEAEQFANPLMEIVEYKENIYK